MYSVSPAFADESAGTQTGGAAGTGHHTGRGNLVAAGRAIEPVFAEFALGLGQPLLLLALGTLAVHFAGFHILPQQQTATGAILGVAFADDGATGRRGAGKDRFAATAPVLGFFHFLADRALVHL